MHFYPTFHIIYTATNAKCSKKPTTFQFSDGHDAVGKHHPDKLLLNSSFVAQLKKKCHWQERTAIVSYFS